MIEVLFGASEAASMKMAKGTVISTRTNGVLGEKDYRKTQRAHGWKGRLMK